MEKQMAPEFGGASLSFSQQPHKWPPDSSVLIEYRCLKLARKVWTKKTFRLN